RPGLMFASIADEIVFLYPMIQNLLPLDAGGKARAASSAEPSFLQFIDDIVRAQLFDALLPGLIAPDLPVGIDIPGSAIKRLENSWFSRSRHAPFLTHLAQRMERYYKVPGWYSSRQCRNNRPESQRLRASVPCGTGHMGHMGRSQRANPHYS